MSDIVLRAISDDDERPPAPSPWDDWGPVDPEAMGLPMRRWLIDLRHDDGSTTPVGDMSAHTVWYGPTPGSRAMNIGISLVPEERGKGIGSTAQRMLAELLHAEGIVRVEASTDVANIAEQHALARAGFAYEGTARRSQQRADGLHDLQVWSQIADA
jgi:RimJ/RimL family protein N-acetyltransferase